MSENGLNRLFKQLEGTQASVSAEATTPAEGRMTRKSLTVRKAARYVLNAASDVVSITPHPDFYSAKGKRSDSAASERLQSSAEELLQLINEKKMRVDIVFHKALYFARNGQGEEALSMLAPMASEGDGWNFLQCGLYSLLLEQYGDEVQRKEAHKYQEIANRFCVGEIAEALNRTANGPEQATARIIKDDDEDGRKIKMSKRKMQPMRRKR